jgi:hypothetical protein
MGLARIDRAPDCVPLRFACEVLTGVKPYKVGAGDPPQDRSILRRRPFTSQEFRRGFLPAVRGRHVRPYGVRREECYIQLGPHLAEMGRHPTLLDVRRVFVREVTGREGSLFAAPAPLGVVPLHGVLTLVPHGIHLAALIALLNSGLVAEWLRHNAAAQLKVDYQRVTATELLRLPVPVAALNSFGRRALRAQFDAPPFRPAIRSSWFGVPAGRVGVHSDPRREAELRADLEPLVESMYLGPIT